MGMGQINREVLEQVRSTIRQQAASGRPSGESARPRDAMLALWQTMSAMYGHRWSSAYGLEPDPDRVWQATLSGITAEQIKSGLRKCALRADPWPPSAPEFRGLCIEEQAQPLHKLLPRLQNPLKDTENFSRARSAMEQFRASRSAAGLRQ